MEQLGWGLVPANKSLSPDSFLHAILSTLDEHTLIYTTTPSGAAPAPAPDAYEMDNKYGSALHTDLKRDLGAHPGRYGAAAQSASLFERYVFLSPGRSFSVFAVLAED
jgi:hypothetical protein